jgi:hypothetical protein
MFSSARNVDPFDTLPDGAAFNVENIKGDSKLERNKNDQILNAVYEAAKEKGSFTFEPALSCPHLIGSQGRTQKTLLLPNGERIGANCSIGLPTKTLDPKFLSIAYSDKDKGYF